MALQTLKQAELRKIYRIVAVKDGALLRLAELGFVAGTTIVLKAIAPLKQTYLIELRGYELAIRSSLADAILLEEATWN